MRLQEAMCGGGGKRPAPFSHHTDKASEILKDSDTHQIPKDAHRAYPKANKQWVEHDKAFRKCFLAHVACLLLKSDYQQHQHVPWSFVRVLSVTLLFKNSSLSLADYRSVFRTHARTMLFCKDFI
eukprot:2045055-Amphidinium_carterae.1